MMAKLKMISPLLDGMIVEKERIGSNGQSSYTLREEKSGEHYILKTLSLPEADSRIRALILSGAYADEAAVHEYYGRLSQDVKAELELGKKLAASECFVGAKSFQIEPKESGVGYDIYILYPLNIALNEFMAMNAMTSLRALNLGIDVCDAITACREAGYLHQDIRPENIYLIPSGKFLLGGLGLTGLEFLEYASVPEEYIGAYSAPELSDITASPNLTIDIYSLGMVLYRIYNGNHVPFEDESTNPAMADKLRLTGKPLPSPIYADYELAEIILKACAFKQEDRYQSPDELKQALVLYMQRNAVSDTLIAPPIVADLDPVPLIDEPIEEEPIRMTEAEDLDENFRQSFAPDFSGAGEDTLDPDLQLSAEEETPEPIVEEVSVPEEEIDPDQIDLETLLASADKAISESAVNHDFTVGSPDSEQSEEADEPELPEAPDTPVEETDAQAPSHDYVDASSDNDEEEAEPTEKKGRSKLLLWGIVATLLVGIALAGYFLLQWYFIDVSEIKTVSTSPTQIVVELTSDDNPKHYKVYCTDSFGNIHHPIRSDNQYFFSSLREKTSYTISVEAEKYHDFSTAVPVLTETTNEYTIISDLSFERLNTNGDILLSFNHKGPVPSQWQLSYAQEDGSDSHTYRFDGESYQINGLELYKKYIFTLDNVDNIFIQGENTIEYEVYPRITASNFTIKDIVDNTVTLTWECGDVTPEQWYVLCKDENGNADSIAVTDTTAEMTVADLSTAYSFTLSALGMDTAERIELDANPIIITNLAAAPDENGNLVVTWDTPAGEPNGQWRISYRLKDGYYNEADGHSVPSVSCDAADENSVTLKYLPANAQYEITLMALDTASNSYPRIFGTTTVEATTAEATPFKEYQILPAAPYGDGFAHDSLIALWEKPAQEPWDYRDLLSQRRATYKTDEKIAMCIQIDSCDLSTAVVNDTVHVTYVVRRASQGGVIMVDDREMKWDSVWFDRRHTGVVPMPLQLDENGNVSVQTGQFLVEVYINGKLLASKGFTLES